MLIKNLTGCQKNTELQDTSIFDQPGQPVVFLFIGPVDHRFEKDKIVDKEKLDDFQHGNDSEHGEEHKEVAVVLLEWRKKRPNMY